MPLVGVLPFGQPACIKPHGRFLRSPESCSNLGFRELTLELLNCIYDVVVPLTMVDHTLNLAQLV